MLAELSHSHCTQMLAFCAKPMTLILELAPHGSLNKILAEFRQSGRRLHVETLQRSALQISKALEYLHVQQRIIYRVSLANSVSRNKSHYCCLLQKDLKSENVLVWRFPMPNLYGRPKTFTSPPDVLIKLGDYGISRFSYPAGVCKGYGGTEVHSDFRSVQRTIHHTISL